MAMVVLDVNASDHPQHPSFTNDRDFRNYLKTVLRFDMFEIDPDGNCFYSAMALHEYEDVEKQKSVRTKIAYIFLKNKREYASFLHSGETVSARAAKIRTNAEWADELEIVVASAAYKTNIVIYQPSGFTRLVPMNLPYERTLRLSYHNGIHYNVLLKDDNPVDFENQEKMDIEIETNKNQSKDPVNEELNPQAPLHPSGSNYSNSQNENDEFAENCDDVTEASSHSGSAYLNNKVFAKGRHTVDIVILVPHCLKKSSLLESLKHIKGRAPIFYTFSTGNYLINRIVDDKEICDDFAIYSARKSIPTTLIKSSIKTWHAELIIPHVLLTAVRLQCLNNDMRIMFHYKGNNLVQNLLCHFWVQNRETITYITDLLLTNKSLFCEKCTSTCPYRDISSHVDLSSFTEVVVEPRNILRIFERMQFFDSQSTIANSTMDALKTHFICDALLSQELRLTKIYKTLDSHGCVSKSFTSYLLLVVDGPLMNDSMTVGDFLINPNICKSLYAGCTQENFFREGHVTTRRTIVGKLITDTSRVYLLRSKKFQNFSDAAYDESTVIEILSLTIEITWKKRKTIPFILLNKKSETAELFGLRDETKDFIKNFCNREIPIFTENGLDDEDFTGNYSITTPVSVPLEMQNELQFNDVVHIYESLKRSTLNAPKC